MRTDKCTAPQFLDLPPKNRGRQVPVVIERGMLRVQFDTEPRRIILSRGRRGGGSRLCAECNGAVIDVRTWTHLAVPPRAFDPRPSKKEVDRAFAAPDADGVIRTGHYNVIQVIDGTVVTIYSWTHPKKGLVWCLASANGFDVSHLKWGGDETYAEVLFELLAKSPTFLAATGLRLRRGLLCVDDVRLDFQTLDRGRCYTIGFRHPNFHPMAADPPGVWNIQSVDLASGVATAAGLPGIPRQAAYNREDLVRLVGSQDVRRRGIRVEDLELISRRALDDAKAAIAGKPVPRLLASREWVFNTSFNYGFILRSRRPEVCPDVLYASPLLHRVRQLIYSRRPPQQVQSARYQYNSLRAFLSPSDRSDFLELFPEFAPCFAMYERFVNNVVDFVINPAEIKNGREGVIAQTILARIKRTERIFSFSNKSRRDIVYDFVVCPEHVVLYLKALDITRMHALH
ncbi:MAG: hypothetical protein AB2822_10985 [Candidatus Thiodiazotropha endolucinida]